MGGGSDSKKQLGKISLQQKRVMAGKRREAGEELKHARDQTRPLVSAPRQAKLLRQEQLRMLSEQRGLPAIDLSEQIVSLSTLRLVPIEIARERAVFAFRLEGDHLMLAMSSAPTRELIEELEFVTAKKIQAFVALEEVIRNVTEQAYAGLQRGDEYYTPPNADEATDAAQRGQSMLAELLGKPDPEATLETGAAGAAPRAPAPAAAASALETMAKAAPVEIAAHETEAPSRTSLTPWLPSERPSAMTLDEAFTHRIPSSLPPAMVRVEPASRVLLAIRAAEPRAALARALEQAGAVVSEVEDGQKALESLRDDRPSLMVLGTLLPSVHGLDICRRLRASSRYEAMPIVMVATAACGWRMAEDLRQSYAVEHFFDAPLDVDKLAQTVRLLLLGQPIPAEPPPLSADAEARWNLAMQAFQAGDVDAAITALESGVSGNPDAFELQYHLGLLYGRRDQVFSAIAALETALTMQPRHFLATKNLAAVCQRAGLRYRAVDAWERAMSVAPDHDTRVSIREHLVSLL